MENNPYQSPYQPAGSSFPTGNPKPTSVTVFGVLNIAFGLMGLCGVAFSSVIFFIPADAAGPNPILQLMEEYPLYRTFMMVSVGLGLIATLVLIVAGIGLMQFKAYGRLLSLGYAFYAIVSGLVGTVVNFVFVVMPLMEKLGDGPEAAGAMGGMIGGTIGGLIGLIYPGLLIYFMTRPNVVQALN